MHICFTDDKSGLITTLEAGLVLSCRRDPSNPLVTHIISGIQGPGDLQAFAVRENPEVIARRVNAAQKCDINPGLLGFPEN